MEDERRHPFPARAAIARTRSTPLARQTISIRRQNEDSTMTLRSNSANSPSRRANWRALGLSPEDMEKPKIAVVNSSSELAICYAHLDGIARMVKDEIRAAGGVPFEVRTAAPSDFIT